MQHPSALKAISWKWQKPSRPKTKQKSLDSPTCRGFSTGCAAVKYDYFFWPKPSDSVENSPGFSIPKGYLCMLSNLYCANRAWQGLPTSMREREGKKKKKKTLFTKRRGRRGAIVAQENVHGRASLAGCPLPHHAHRAYLKHRSL